MQKNFLIDLDGTLLKKPEFIFRNKDLKSIENLKKSNHFFGIATGRSLREIEFLEETQGIKCDFKIAMNGMSIRGNENKDYFFNNEILNFLVKKNIKFEAQSNEKRILSTECGKSVIKKLLGTPMIVRDHFTEEDEIKKIVIRGFNNERSLPEIKEIIKQKFSDEYNIFTINDNSLEIVSYGISKGSQLKKIFSEREFTVGIGDSENDKEMLLAVNQGYLMEKADEELKTELSSKKIHVIKSVSEGIYAEIINCKGVIFDLDGVITDTAHLHYKAWKMVADKIGAKFDEQFNENLKGVDRKNSLKKILDRSNLILTPEEENLILKEKNDYYVSLLSDIKKSDILPGIEKFIQRLKNKGIKLAVASASKNALFILKKVELLNQFDYIVDVEKIKNGKPDPEIFLAAAKGLGIDLNEIVGIEDSQAGIESLNRANIYSIGIGNLKDSTFLIDKVEDLNTGKIDQLFFKGEKYEKSY